MLRAVGKGAFASSHALKSVATSCNVQTLAMRNAAVLTPASSILMKHASTRSIVSVSRVPTTQTMFSLPRFSSRSSTTTSSSSSSSSSSIATTSSVRSFADDANISNDTITTPVQRMRNIAVIAHVDHGKTTMVDSLLKSAGTRMNAGEVRLMDSNQLEKERGITILAKCTSIIWKDARTSEDLQVNIVDTPGHADFGGEVERIMSMVDGVTLIVDATEGPMAQTKFVLKKALARGLTPVVVINKVDRPTARVGEVENEIFDLFVNLDATDAQLDYTTVYASGRSGWASAVPATEGTDMKALFEAIVDRVPHPKVDLDAPFQMLVTQIESDHYFGKCLIGRITSGSIKAGDQVKALDEEGKEIENVRVLKVLRRRGMNRFVVDQAFAGDIVSIAGFSNGTVNTTLAAPSLNTVIPSIPIDPPTLSMTFQVNDSPLAGREGSTLTFNALRTRLMREAENNVSIKVGEGAVKDSIEVRARGELQLGIIIETIRREGSELAVTPPQVVFMQDPETKKILEPMEEVTLDVEEHLSGSVIEKLSKRSGEMKEYTPLKDGRVRILFHIPTRGLLGYRSEFMNDTRGQGIMNQAFLEYVPHRGTIERTEKGALICTEEGQCTAYALEMLEARGVLFVEPTMKVYKGMVLGESSRSEDLELNPCKAKQLSNIRTVSKDEKIRLAPPRKMSLEELIAYVRDDEIIEVTPQNLRLRKRFLDPIARKNAAKTAKSVFANGTNTDPRFMASMNMKA